LFSAKTAKADDCGSSTVCKCGDNVTTNYTLTSDLNCSGWGTALNIGADNITISGNNPSGENFKIVGDGSNGIGISNHYNDSDGYNKGYNNATIENLTVTGFMRGISIYAASGVIVQHTNINSNNFDGIFLYGGVVTDATITKNIITLNPSGIDVAVSGSSITNNAITSNETGISFSVNSFNNTINGNTITSNNIGIVDNSGKLNSLTNNNFYYNNRAIGSPANSGFLSNNLFGNLNNNALVIQPPTNTYQLGDTIHFTASTFNEDGTTACMHCATITLSPSETSLTYADNVSGNITGFFIPTRIGTYSLTFSVTDSGGNKTERQILYFVGNTSSQTTRYYFRSTGTTHGQPYGTDAYSMLSDAPNGSESWQCIKWVQNSPDVEPIYPLSFLANVNDNIFYTTFNNSPFMGVERYADHNGDLVDYSVNIPQSGSVS